MRRPFNVNKAEGILDDLKIFWRSRNQDLSTFNNLCQRSQKYHPHLDKRSYRNMESRIYSIALSDDFPDDIRGRGLSCMISINGRDKVVLWLECRYYTYEITRKGVTWCLEYLGEPPYAYKRNYRQNTFPY